MISSSSFNIMPLAQSGTPEPENTNSFPRFDDVTLLNRSDLEELLRHRDLIGLEQVSLLQELSRKVEVFPSRYSDPHYLPTGSLLIASQWQGSRRFAFCSVANNFNHSGVCRSFKFCPYCCFLRQQDLLLTYFPVFHKGFFQFATLSYTGNVHFNEPGQAYHNTHYWDATKVAIKSLVAENWIEGALWVEELGIRSLNPLLVLPHAHAIFHSVSIPDNLAGELEERMQNHLSSLDEELSMVPNVRVSTLTNEADLFYRLRYLSKPIALAAQYRLVFSTLPETREGATRLNSNVRDLLSGLTEVTKMRHQLLRKGSMDPKRKTFVGIPTNQRDNHREYVQEFTASLPVVEEVGEDSNP